MKYTEAIAYLESFQDMERDPGKSAKPAMNVPTLKKLLNRLGNPELGQQTIHITGTNGKGSVAHMVESILRTSGTSTALFTSPHLQDYPERIQINNLPISKDFFAEGLTKLRGAIEEEQKINNSVFSTFGILTALFFWVSREKKSEWKIVEVGLGGTFDATNVFERTEVAVITAIDFDHTHILGRTVEEIAKDKAGIIKPGSLCILGPQSHPVVETIITAACKEVKAQLIKVITPTPNIAKWKTPLLGFHQQINAEIAATTADSIKINGKRLSKSKIEEGIHKAQPRGRIELVSSQPTTIIDAAHNPAAVRALISTLQEEFGDVKWQFVIGIMADKDIQGISVALEKIGQTIICCSLPSRRALTAKELEARLGKINTPIISSKNVSEGLQKARDLAGKTGHICMLGSFITASEGKAAVRNSP